MFHYYIGKCALGGNVWLYGPTKEIAVERHNAIHPNQPVTAVRKRTIKTAHCWQYRELVQLSHHQRRQLLEIGRSDL